jgi:hypothetical protein
MTDRQNVEQKRKCRKNENVEQKMPNLEWPTVKMSNKDENVEQKMSNENDGPSKCRTKTNKNEELIGTLPPQVVSDSQVVLG